MFSPRACMGWPRRVEGLLEENFEIIVQITQEQSQPSPFYDGLSKQTSGSTMIRACHVIFGDSTALTVTHDKDDACRLLGQ